MKNKILKALFFILIITMILGCNYIRTDAKTQYANSKSKCTLKFARCASPDMVFLVGKDERCDFYRVRAFDTYKKGKLKNDYGYFPFDADAIKKNRLYGTYTTSGPHSTKYFIVESRNKKTKKWHKTPHIWKVTRGGTVTKIK